MRVVIIGGSMGGLTVGISLLRTGKIDVHIYEKSSKEMMDRGAGLVIQPEVIQFLEDLNTIEDPLKVISVPLTTRRYLALDGTVDIKMNQPQRMASWDAIYRVLKPCFPDDRYHNSKKFVSLQQKDNQVTVSFEDGSQISCDLLICADGVNSTARHLLLHDQNPIYAGYVAFRGVIAENQLPDSILKEFDDTFTFYQGPNTQMLCYFIPSENGVKKGQRRLNWVWYWNYDEKELDAVLTDKDGIRRSTSVPKGKIAPHILQKQAQIAKENLPPQFQQLFMITKDIFIQSIIDLAVTKMVSNRVCLIGDAAFVLRPHTASGTSKAFSDSMQLVKALKQSDYNVDKALKHWEPIQLHKGKDLVRYGLKLGLHSHLGVE